MDRRSQASSRYRIAGAALAATLVAAAACSPPGAAMTKLGEARNLASAMRISFGAATQAANLAVMAGTEAGAAAAAAEARQARQAVSRDAATLGPLLDSLRYEPDQRLLREFLTRYDVYERLDEEALALAVEGTNMKAQRLSFGTGAAAADAFVAAVDAIARVSPDADPRRSAAARAALGVREVQALQAPHIAEADDAAMTAIEARMEAAIASSRRALDELLAGLPQAQGRTAVTALDRFLAVHADILSLSRRNTNVHSLALSLGRKRSLAAECTDWLRQLDEALAKHAFTATR